MTSVNGSDVVRNSSPDTACHLSKPLALQINQYHGPNPFQSRTDQGRWFNMLKIIIMSLAMVPLIRLLLIAICVCLCCLLAGLANLGRNMEQPMSLWRRFLFIGLVRVLFRVILFIAGFYWISVTDDRKYVSTKEEARVLVANHISIFDSLKIFVDTGCCLAAKEPLFHIPLLGTLMKGLQFVPVYRDTPEGRKASLDAIKHACTRRGAPPLLVFPQGTTANDQVLTMFKRGPFAPGVTVSPVCIRYPNCFNDLYLGNSMAWSAWTGLCQVVNFASYHYLQEHVPSEEERRDDTLFAANVRHSMAEALRVPVTEHAYADVLLLAEAEARGVHVAHAAREVTVADIARLCHLRMHEILALLNKFAAADVDRSGALEYGEFCAALGVPAGTASPWQTTAQRIFDLFDADGDGRISFREFLVGVAIFSARCSALDGCEVLFRICDLDGDGRVQRHELQQVLHMVTQPSTPRNKSAAPAGQHQSRLRVQPEQGAVSPRRIAFVEQKQQDRTLPTLTTQGSLSQLAATVDQGQVLEAVFPAGATEVTKEQWNERLEQHPKIQESLLLLFLFKRMRNIKV